MPFDTGHFAQGTAAGGLIPGLAYGFFGNTPDPYDKANKYFNQIPGQAHQAFDPYIQQGQKMGQQVGDQYSQLLSNPGQRVNQIGQSFQQSPGYQFQLQQGQNAVNNAAAAGGMLGTPAHLQNANQVTQGIANQDYYNYLHEALGLYGQGLSGGQQQQNLGYGASSQLANTLTSNLQNQGALAYGQQSDQNKSQQQMWGDIFGTLGTIAAFA